MLYADRKNRILISCALFAAAVCIWLRLSPVNSTSGVVDRHNTVIVIDAGHGGIDGGTTGRSGTVEKDINLQIALITREFCTYFGFETYMTRTTDKSLNENSTATIKKQKSEDLKQRLKLTLEQSNPIYIGIHQNFYGDYVSRGAQVFFYKNNESGEAFAKTIQGYLRNIVDPENHREAAKNPNPNYMLENLTCPAVIVECGFLSHPEEEMLLKSQDYQAKISFALCISTLQTLCG